MSSLFINQPLGLLTDFYELTMAYGYWKLRMTEYESVFHLFFRRLPFKGGFCIAAGLNGVIEYLKNYRFDASDLHYLETLRDDDNLPLFEKAFLDYLGNLRFSCQIDALTEGTVVFPYEPLLRIQGPLIQCQLLESPLLTLTNFPTLIATKAARICLSANNDPVVEFGLRRAQGINGALTATRAAYIGGCSATSNTLGGKILGIPVKGTHAHSWVMAFENELESFQAYAEALPANCIFLVDTYDTLKGVQNAIEVGKWLKRKGKKLLGIRLDSGDLTYLSIESRRMLDEAGFPEAIILASNELDETIIADLKHQGAKIAVWGVGTHLVTGQGQSALDGVYKLSALKKAGGIWKYKLKLSEQMTKISNPGILQVRRYFSNKKCVADMLYHQGTDLSQGALMIDPFDRTRQMQLTAQMEYIDLLVPIFRDGQLIYQEPSLDEIRTHTQRQLAQFDRSIKRFIHPHIYPVGMEEWLFDLKIKLIKEIRFSKKKRLKNHVSIAHCRCAKRFFTWRKPCSQ